ncbi:MAG: L,D-transpeptidase family protein [Deltaproteobacteria bacterium]|nr:L,D-transpeptidase family protein [Deltaproteobacteria bacterium]
MRLPRTLCAGVLCAASCAGATWAAPGEPVLRWTRDGQPTPQALALVAALQRAEEKGLVGKDYASAQWQDRLRALEAAPPRAGADELFESQLTEAGLRYVRDLSAGRVEPMLSDWRRKPRTAPLDAEAFLRELSLAADVDGALAGIECHIPIYQRTLAALRTYQELARREPEVPLPPWKTLIEPGDSAPGLALVAHRLALAGDLVTEPTSVERYDGELLEAVRRFQARHGLRADGKLDRRTWRALSVPWRTRVRQLTLALERLRWMPAELRPPLLVVNLPAYSLRAIPAPDEPGLEMRVVVGRAFRHRTPVFLGAVESVRFHPFWNVPATIANHELLPELMAHPERVASLGFELVDDAGAVQEGAQEGVHAAVIDEHALELALAGKLHLRQRPGVANALGPVKLEIPNPYGVYLHGTPAGELFERTRRDFSHGCIRVEHPEALAAWALGRTPGWSEAQVQAAIASGETTQVPLAEPLPVVILYSTAVVAADGRVSFFEDIYGDDRRLESQLLLLSARRDQAASARR